ncbi:MAG: S1C family serine protease [Caldimonas sp.]|nr:S1C family serine protease [Pseudomonadota bacterium]
MPKPPPATRLRRTSWRRAGLAFTLWLIAASGSESLAHADTLTGIAAPANAVLARLDERKAALSRAHAAVIGVEVTAVEDARSIATLGRAREGSGVVIGADGLVLTIGYLILEADHIDLVIDGGRRVPARVIAEDIASGFGLLQALTPLALAPVPLGASSSIQHDEPLMIASGGGDADLSLARLVSRRPFSGYWEYYIDGALFTAPARADHSGAGLFNGNGELVGIGSLVVTDAAGAGAPALRGNMFVPVDLLKPILSELRAHGASRDSTRPWLGLNCIEAEGHVRVVRLTPEGPAEDAGLQPGDIIQAVDGVAIGDLASFYKTLWRDHHAEREVSIDIQRGEETMHLKARAIDRTSTFSRPQGI